MSVTVKVTSTKSQGNGRLFLNFIHSYYTIFLVPIRWTDDLVKIAGYRWMGYARPVIVSIFRGGGGAMFSSGRHSSDTMMKMTFISCSKMSFINKVKFKLKLLFYFNCLVSLVVLSAAATLEVLGSPLPNPLRNTGVMVYVFYQQFCMFFFSRNISSGSYTVRIMIPTSIFFVLKYFTRVIIVNEKKIIILFF